MRLPPTCTSPPFTSWPAFSKTSVYVGPRLAAQDEEQRDDDRDQGRAEDAPRAAVTARPRARPVGGCGDAGDGGGLRWAYSIPSGPWDSPERNCRTKALSELKSSSAGPDSTIRPFHSTEMCSATRQALMMSCVMTT